LDSSSELFEGNDIAIIPGVKDTQSNEKIIRIKDVTNYPNMLLGIFE
jgi:hypothetical protein